MNKSDELTNQIAFSTVNEIIEARVTKIKGPLMFLAIYASKYVKDVCHNLKLLNKPDAELGDTDIFTALRGNYEDLEGLMGHLGKNLEEIEEEDIEYFESLQEGFERLYKNPGKVYGNEGEMEKLSKLSKEVAEFYRTKIKLRDAWIRPSN